MTPPLCSECHRPMQLRDQNDSSESYVCGCNGRLKYENVHKGQRKREVTSGN